MSRTRFSWDWVGDWPIFVYTTFIDHGKFNVMIYKGEKNNQNAASTVKLSEYVEDRYSSKALVVQAALDHVAQLLNIQQAPYNRKPRYLQYRK